MWKAIKWLRNCDKSTIFNGQVFEPLFTQVFYNNKKLFSINYLFSF